MPNKWESKINSSDKTKEYNLKIERNTETAIRYIAKDCQRWTLLNWRT